MNQSHGVKSLVARVFGIRIGGAVSNEFVDMADGLIDGQTLLTLLKRKAH